jgi:excisionase family DNA binding protein
MNTETLEALTIDQVAERLNLSKRTVNRLISDGVFPRPVKIGRLSRWVPEDIRNFLNKMTDKR